MDGSGTMPAIHQAATPSTEMPLTFFLRPVLLHPVRYLPQAVKKEVSLLQADDLREEAEAGMAASGEYPPRRPSEAGSRNAVLWLGGLGAHWG